jgi:hypothetical protein
MAKRRANGRPGCPHFVPLQWHRKRVGELVTAVLCHIESLDLSLTMTDDRTIGSFTQQFLDPLNSD